MEKTKFVGRGGQADIFSVADNTEFFRDVLGIEAQTGRRVLCKLGRAHAQDEARLDDMCENRAESIVRNDNLIHD